MVVCTAVRCLTLYLMRSGEPTPRKSFSKACTEVWWSEVLLLTFCDNWLILQGNGMGKKSFWTRFCSLDVVQL